LRQANHAPTKLVAYCRVSSAAQKPDLANQRKVLEEFVVAKGLAGVEFIEEVGSGLNFRRKRFLALMDEIGRREVRMLIVAHRDRLTRFGFDTPEPMAAKCWSSTRNGCLPNRKWCKT
jgi:predicted site-specific integrase-resolvase